VPCDSKTSAKVDAIARALAGEQATEHQLTSAADYARAQLELLHIRSIRAERLANIDLNRNNMEELQRLAALDRYERYALTRRRQASMKF
jgi:hypothetical protein